MLVKQLPVTPGDPFLPFAAENAFDHIRDVYWRRGYNDVHADYELTLDRNSGQVDVRFTVAEGAAIGHRRHRRDRQRQDQRAPGARTTRAAPSQPLDLGGLARSRKKSVRHASLLDRRHHAGRAADRAGPAAGTAERVGPRSATDSAALRRSPTTPSAAFGGIFDLSNHNSLGKARVIGLALALRCPAARGARVLQSTVAALLANSDDGESLLHARSATRRSIDAPLSTSIAAVRRFSRSGSSATRTSGATGSATSARTSSTPSRAASWRDR